ncbi:hypothetical protein WA158_001204 [Blastocystis sp. Blastoise]
MFVPDNNIVNEKPNEIQNVEDTQPVLLSILSQNAIGQSEENQIETSNNNINNAAVSKIEADSSNQCTVDIQNNVNIENGTKTLSQPLIENQKVNQKSKSLVDSDNEFIQFFVSALGKSKNDEPVTQEEFDLYKRIYGGYIWMCLNQFIAFMMICIAFFCYSSLFKESYLYGCIALSIPLVFTFINGCLYYYWSCCATAIVTLFGLLYFIYCLFTVDTTLYYYVFFIFYVIVFGINVYSVFYLKKVSHKEIRIANKVSNRIIGKNKLRM